MSLESNGVANISAAFQKIPISESATIGTPQMESYFQQAIKQLVSGRPEINQILNQQLKPQELLIYQIQASNYHLRIELLSKVSESLLQSFKRIQANQ